MLDVWTISVERDCI